MESSTDPSPNNDHGHEQTAINIPSQDQDKQDTASKTSTIDNTPIPDVPQTFRERIINNLILPSYWNDLKRAFDKRGEWDKIADYISNIIILLTCIITILSFINNQLKADYMTDIIGSISSLSLVFHTLKNYAQKNERNNTLKINALEKKLNIKDDVIDESKFEN